MVNMLSSYKTMHFENLDTKMLKSTHIDLNSSTKRSHFQKTKQFMYAHRMNITLHHLFSMWLLSGTVPVFSFQEVNTSLVISISDTSTLEIIVIRQVQGYT